MTAEPTVMVIEQTPANAGGTLRLALSRVGGIRVRASVEADQGLPPHLIVLDLDDLKESGLQALSALKLQARTKNIPVIVFTSCGEAAAVERAYSLGASTCLRKTPDQQAINEVARAVRDFAGILAAPLS